MRSDLDHRWRPRRARESTGPTDYDVLHPGVPDWLEASLWNWVSLRLKRMNVAKGVLFLERSLHLSGFDYNSEGSLLASLYSKLASDGELFLDAVDALLSQISTAPRPPDWNDPDPRADERHALELITILEQAGSLWGVAIADDHLRLERRVPEPVKAAAEQVMSTQGKAAQHLQLAWRATYGREPNASIGYREAIRAVEAAAIPVVIPSDPLPTLGKVIHALRNKPGKWMMSLHHSEPERQITTVADLLDLMWKGQSDRHGSPDTAVPIAVDLEQTQAAVALAVTAVQWFTAGAIRSR